MLLPTLEDKSYQCVTDWTYLSGDLDFDSLQWLKVLRECLHFHWCWMRSSNYHAVTGAMELEELGSILTINLSCCSTDLLLFFLQLIVWCSFLTEMNNTPCWSEHSVICPIHIFAILDSWLWCAFLNFWYLMFFDTFDWTKPNQYIRILQRGRGRGWNVTLPKW